MNEHDKAVEAEKSLLGALLVHPEGFAEAADILAAADFYRKAHAVVFETMIRLDSEGTPITPITIQHALSREDLREVGKAYLFQLTDGMPTGGYVKELAVIVREYAIKRELVAHGRRVIADVQKAETNAEGMLSEAEATIDRLRGRAVRVEIQNPTTRSNVAFGQLEAITEGRGIHGVTTGLKALDADLRGLHPGNLVLVGARPSQGKSCLALTMAMAAAHATKVPALFFSLEMSSDELNLRELTMRAQVDGWRLSHGALRDAEYPRVADAIMGIREGGVHVIDSPSLTVGKIRVLARRARAATGISLVVIDYLQLLDDGRERGDNRTQALGDISRALKVLARELNVPVVALSQLNRNVEERPDRRPRLSDLRESGSLEQDADVVLLIHRPCVYFPQDHPPEHAEIIIAKSRNGPTGQIDVEFIAEQTRFTNKRVA